MGEDHKVGVRSARRDAMTTAKAEEKKSELTKDESHRVQNEVQKLTDDFIEKIDQAVSSKEQEILRV